MDAYLELAEQVLRASRKPLGPREILRRAYADHLVPEHLFGKTQHKTLQARLSEDILLRRDRSVFFRTEPGKFFLRAFLYDETVPAQYRVPIVARRRSRELPLARALAIDVDAISKMLTPDNTIPKRMFAAAMRSRAYHYAASTTDRAKSDVLVWSYVLVLHENFVLSYRHGRYREEREGFLRRRSIGFFVPVVEDDLTLFEQSDHGIVEAGLRALCVDLDIASDVIWGELRSASELRCVLYGGEDLPHRDVLAVVNFHCPDWFEPLTRRLAINDLRWHDLSSRVNHVEDFDPWSQVVLERVQTTIPGPGLMQHGGG